MAKERLNAIDVAISVANLKKLVNNLTLVNIYDITNRVFILKFSKNENKIYVLIEIGCRIHATQFLRSVDHLPSNFNAKLRKHLRNRRLRDVSQMSQDRIIDFTFSSEEYAHHLVVQLFLPGNIYLTDHEYKVMTVLRPQNTGDKFFKVGTNYIFDMDYNSWFEPVKKPLVEELLSSKKLVDLFKEIFPSVNNSFVLSTLALKLKNEGKADTDSKKLDRLYTMEELDEVYQYVEYVRQHLVDLLSRKDKVPGYVYKNSKGDMEDFGVFEQPNSDYFDDFNDALDAFFTKNELVKQEKKTVDKKPTKLNKIKVDQDKREAKLMEEINKLDKEIKILEENIDISDNCLNLTKALIASGASWNDIYEQLQIQRKQNHPLVKYIKEINIPNQTLTFVSCSSNQNSNMDNEEKDDNNKEKEENKNKKQKNKEKQKLNENEVVLDYGLNSQQNLKNLYNSRKKLENKLERTRIGKEYALKKVTKRLSKQKEEKKVNKRGRDVRISSLRKRFWFEKFYWFITSQGYLVLAGRDSLQNELLVKRYLTKGDLYFHADIHGASSVILKMDCNDFGNNKEDNEKENEKQYKEENNKENEDKNKKETNETQKDKKEEKDKEKLVFKEGEENEELVNRIKVSIEEAGSFAVCHSNAWNDRFLVQSWWVYWYQVSKTPPTGEYVPQGSFVIRGKKNYLQPQKLEMGITYLFQVHPFQSLDEENEKEDNNENNNKDNENKEEETDEDRENEDMEESELLENGTENEEEEYSEDDMDEDEESDDDDVDDEEEDSEQEEEEEIEEDEEKEEDNEENEDDKEKEVENEDEDEKEEEENDKVVRMGNVEMIGEYEANIQRRTRDRKATAHPLKFQLAKLKNQLQKLNLTSTSSNKSSKSSTKYFDNKEDKKEEKEEEQNKNNNKENEEETNTKDKGKDKKRVSVGFKDEVEEVGEKDGRSVRIVEPEKLTHTEEAVRKIRQRKLTCLNPNLSKLGNLLKMNSRDKEEDDEEDKEKENKNKENKKEEQDKNKEKQKLNEKKEETNSTKEEKEFYRDIEVKKMEHEKEKESNKEKEKQNKKENNREKQDKVKGTSRMMRFLNQKVNKIKKKYGQDDEETQELRRMLTGSKKVQKQRNSKGAMLLTLEINKPKDRFNKENKEIKTLNDRELENYMNQLSCLSRQHKEDDDVLNVIPMCAPYTAIKHYKNTIKLVPGNAKKGTIATHSLQHFIKNDPDNAHYLKLITTDQLTLTLIGNCKFTNTKN